MAEAFFSKAKDLVDTYSDLFKLPRTMDAVEQNFNEGPLWYKWRDQFKNFVPREQWFIQYSEW